MLGFAQAAQHPEPDSTHARLLNKLIKQALETKDLELKFVKLDKRNRIHRRRVCQ